MGMSEAVRRWKGVLLLALFIGGLFSCGWKWVEVRRYKSAMVEIEEDIESGRHGTAARKLTALVAGQPDSDEANYLLGTCEMARGKTQAADAAWARVRRGSHFAPSAILGSMQVQMELGRFSAAEKIIKDALDDPRVDGSSLPILLAPVYCHQGRLDETLQLIETRWDALYRVGEGATEPAINLIRAHIELRRSPIPIEVTRAVLDEAAKRALDDDRVWLGKANLAMSVGSYDEAARWLDDCLRRRPDDEPVWRARLEWAVKTNRVAAAEQAVKHLPTDQSTPAQIHKLAAWKAKNRGDAESERHALELLIDIDPADLEALDRLVELAAKHEQSERATELRRQRSEIERLEARYLKLFERNQPQRDAAEMAHLAKRIGRRFEARAFQIVADAVVGY
jgi:predicted Zn-dependent protease